MSYSYFFLKGLNEEQGASVYQWAPTFIGGLASVTIDMPEAGLYTAQSMWADNSRSQAPLVLTIAGTRQRITVPAGGQLHKRIYAPASVLNIHAVCAAPTDVQIHISNLEHHEEVYIPPGAPAGTQFVELDNSGANSPVVAVVAASTGRATYITEVFCTGNGATAGTTVQLVINNVQRPAGLVAITYDVAVPAGAATVGTLFRATFNPPLLGSSITASPTYVTVGAFGAGNTIARCGIMGYYL